MQKGRQKMSNDFNRCTPKRCVHITRPTAEGSMAYGEFPGQIEPGARSSAVERSVHIGEVTGSIPVAPTIVAAFLALLMTTEPVLANADAEALVRDAAARHGVPTDFALRVAKQESGVKCGRVGAHGEVGPLQILPATSRGIKAPVSRKSSCADQTDAGMKHLGMCYRGMAGNRWFAAACHNQGLGTINGRRIAKAARRYADSVLGVISQPIKVIAKAPVRKAQVNVVPAADTPPRYSSNFRIKEHGPTAF